MNIGRTVTPILLAFTLQFQYALLLHYDSVFIQKLVFTYLYIRTSRISNILYHKCLWNYNVQQRGRGLVITNISAAFLYKERETNFGIDQVKLDADYDDEIYTKWNWRYMYIKTYYPKDVTSLTKVLEKNEIFFVYAMFVWHMFIATSPVSLLMVFVNRNVQRLLLQNVLYSGLWWLLMANNPITPYTNTIRLISHFGMDIDLLVQWIYIKYFLNAFRTNFHLEGNTWEHLKLS